MVKGIEKEPTSKSPEEIRLEELSELSGVSPEEIKKFEETGDKYGFWREGKRRFFYEPGSEEAEKAKVEKVEKEAFKKLSEEEKNRVLQEYVKTRNQITDKMKKMQKELTGYESLMEQTFGSLSKEEMEKAEEKQKEWNDFSQEEKQEKLEPLQKLEKLLKPEEE